MSVLFDNLGGAGLPNTVEVFEPIAGDNTSDFNNYLNEVRGKQPFYVNDNGNVLDIQSSLFNIQSADLIIGLNHPTVRLQDSLPLTAKWLYFFGEFETNSFQFFNYMVWEGMTFNTTMQVDFPANSNNITNFITGNADRFTWTNCIFQCNDFNPTIAGFANAIVDRVFMRINNASGFSGNFQHVGNWSDINISDGRNISGYFLSGDDNKVFVTNLGSNGSVSGNNNLIDNTRSNSWTNSGTGNTLL